MPNHPPPNPSDKSREAIKVTAIGAAVDGVLGVGKIVTGWLFFSHALVADGIHSLSDLLTDFMVLAIVKVSGAEADAEHPYGHARFETLGAAFLGFLLLAVAVAMVYKSGLDLLAVAPLTVPGWPALAVALVSVIAKEWVFRYTRSAGRRLGSDLLIANAWHSRSDAWSSLLVFAGVGGAMLGLPWLDSLAAFGVALFIAKIGWDLSHKALRELVDTAIDPGELKALTDAAMKVEGIRGVHSAKSRRMGAKILLELHLQVAPYLSVSESHYIGDRVVMRLMREFDTIGHIIFHIDTEHDDENRHNSELPLRAEVTALVDQALDATGSGLKRERILLHYLQEQIEVELFLTVRNELTLAEQEALGVRLNCMLSEFEWFRRIRLWYPG